MGLSSCQREQLVRESMCAHIHTLAKPRSSWCWYTQFVGTKAGREVGREKDSACKGGREVGREKGQCLHNTLLYLEHTDIIYVHMYIRIRIYMHTYMYTYIHTYIRIHTHIHIYIYIHTHTHTHIHTRAHTRTHPWKMWHEKSYGKY